MMMLQLLLETLFVSVEFNATDGVVLVCIFIFNNNFAFFWFHLTKDFNHLNHKIIIF